MTADVRSMREAPACPPSLTRLGFLISARPERKRAAGDVHPPPPRTFTLSQRSVLRAAAPRATASFLLGCHAGSRALVAAADAGAARALAPARLAATAAIARLTARPLAAEGGGHERHEGQCRQEKQTVHGKDPLHETLNRSRHVTTCDRGKTTADVIRPAGSRPSAGRRRFGGRFSSARRHTGPGLAGSARQATPPHTLG